MVLHAMNDDRLGPYRLLRRLGEGGMGVVHLAVDPQGREVAVKVLRAEVTGDDVARRRLAREVETMRRVRSEHIAEVIDADVTGHRPYIVTRYVPGRPLDDLVKEEGPLDLPAVLRVAKGVASALAAVHAVGVIHRDLKPGNVLIMDGEPVLIDFGIAQAVDATRLTQTGMFIGTPGYLAPEIIEGQEAGPEVDVHAWAGTMLFACTGEPPFGKGTLEMVFYNITAGKANVDAAPPPLRPLLRDAFQRDPAKRPTAAELAERVERLMAGSAARPSVPDAISTVPDGGLRVSQVEPSPPPVGSPWQYTPGPAVREREHVPLPGESGPSAPRAAAVPPASPPVDAAPTPPAVPGAQHGPDAGDPYPTRRVTPEELRQIRSATDAAPANATPWQAAPARSWDAPTQADAAAMPSPYPLRGGAGPVPPKPAAPSEGDVPTTRVRPNELPGYVHGYHQPAPGTGMGPAAAPGGPRYAQGTPGYATGRRAASALASESPAVPSGYGGQPHGGYPQQPYPPQQHHQGFPQHAPRGQSQGPPPPGGLQTQAGAAEPSGSRPALSLKPQRVYVVSAIFLMVIATATAIIAPIIAAVVVVPLVILLRAADIAQRELSTRRPAGTAALDVLRVLTMPAVLARSVGITLALVPYALILGLPVTLLLTVLLGGMPLANALSWGTAVALWTICAGPGVEGPGRQMRKTLVSLMPSRGVAVGVAWTLAAVGVIMSVLAIGSLTSGAKPAVWAPIDIQPITEQLSDLRTRAAQ